MKLAIISPNSLLDRYSQTDYHLILPDMLKDPEYYRFYHSVARGWKVLDNGAHEEGTRSPNELFRIAEILQVDEIVVPDVIGDRGTTLDMAASFEPHAYEANPRYQYMGVVQGSSAGEAWECLRELTDYFPWIKSIGIPQHLCRFDQHIRVEMAETIDQWMGHQVHLLGNNSRWPREVKHLSDLKCVVGHDTTYPVKMGLRGYYISDREVPNVPRDPDYFEFYRDVVELQDYVIKENIRVYKSWCDGTT